MSKPRYFEFSSQMFYLTRNPQIVRSTSNPLFRHDLYVNPQ